MYNISCLLEPKAKYTLYRVLKVGSHTKKRTNRYNCLWDSIEKIICKLMRFKQNAYTKRCNSATAITFFDIKLKVRIGDIFLKTLTMYGI